MRSSCLVSNADHIPTFDGAASQTESDPKPNILTDDVVKMSISAEEDQELTHHRSLWREHLAQHDDVEIETDALSLFEILRGI